MHLFQLIFKMHILWQMFDFILREMTSVDVSFFQTSSIGLKMMQYLDFISY